MHTYKRFMIFNSGFNPASVTGKILFFILLLFSTTQAKAGYEKYIDFRKGDDIAADSLLYVVDPQLGIGTFNLYNYNINVVLRFDDSRRDYYDSTFTFKVKYHIKLYKANGTCDTVSDSLEIYYNAIENYRDIHFRQYQGYVKSELEILSVSRSSGLSSTPDDVFLELELEFNRFYTTTTSYAPVIYRIDEDIVNNELRIGWDYAYGHESYDLEWLFVDTSAFDKKNFKYDFRNATRITLPYNHYYIPLAYPSGILLYRIRSVGTTVDALGARHPKYSNWSITSDTGSISSISSAYKYNIPGLESNLSWQYSATFAEDGKRKEVISFFDGLLSTRQQVTIVNTDSNAIVAESFYDYKGRAAVQMLPAPTQGEGMKFYHNGDTSQMFNGIFDKDFFDTDATVESPLAINDSSNISLSDAYYSASNSFLSKNDYNAYIPDAESYPYIQTRFMTDGTDRILRQGGAGSTFQMGSGRETRYYYGTPTSQQELDRLFGNEVGYVSHYKKNMVLDPNGQVSISYLDMQNRVIATALAGKAENLLLCDNMGDFDTIFGSLDCSDPANSNNEKVVTSTIAVTSAGNVYYFDYDLGNLALCDTCFVCKDCWYNLSIRVKNIQTGVNLYFMDTIVNQAHIEFSVPMPVIGTYEVTKKLSLLTDSVNSYVNQYQQNQTCVAVTQIEPEPCVFSCEDYCFSVYASIFNGDTIFLDQNRDTISDSLAMIKIDSCKRKNCNEMTDNRTECQIKKDIMTHDITPGGQYFENFPAKFLLDSSGIAYPNPDYESHRNDWLVSLSVSGGFDSVVFRQTFNPPNYINVYYQSSNYDTCWSWVRINWNDSWTDNMFALHPEHCLYYLNCECGPKVSSFVLGSHQSYDSLMMFTFYYDFVQDYYLFNPLGMQTNTNPSNYWISQSSSIGYMPYDVPPGDSLEDPLFVNWEDYSCFNQRCLPDTARNIIMDSLIHFIPLPDTSAWASIWFLLDDPINIADSSDSSIYGPGLVDLFQIFQHSLLPGLDTIYGSREMSKFAVFRNVYLFFKQQLLAYTIENCPSGPYSNCGYLPMDTTIFGQAVDTAGYAIRWIKNPIFDFFNSANFKDSTETAAIENCMTICEENAGTWMMQLDDYITEYSLNSSQVADLRSDLISLCQDSCSLDHFSGMLDSARLVNILNSYCSSCNDFPIIHQPQPVYSANSCSCGNWEDMLTQLGFTLGSDSLAISDSISYYYGYNFSADTIGLWNHLCSGTPTLASLQSSGFPDFLLCNENAYNTFPTYQSYIDSLVSECELLAQQTADAMEQNLYLGELNDSLIVFNSYLTSECMNKADERFRVRYMPAEYIFTLYYYDQAGNLIKTVPPEGVVPIRDTVLLDSVAYYREHGNGYIHPQHGLISGYQFNSLQQTTRQGTPDADTSNSFYDIMGRIVVSQSAEQNSRDAYAYTLYDALSRIIEVGEISNVPFEMKQDSAYLLSTLENWISSGNRSQITRTYYDQPVKYRIPTRMQQNLRSRVAAVTYSDIDYGYDSLYNSAIHYSYDIHGNVNLIVQDIPMLTSQNRRYIKTEYSYDLISGKVNMVTFQRGLSDCFMHKYLYDADNRITHVFVSKDGLIWERDAKYFYYPHGPLARTEIGDRQVQATDYLYTIQGWIKGMNSNTLYAYRDPGKDAVYDTTAGIFQNANFAGDAASYSLNYFSEDYSPIGGITYDSLPVATPDPSMYTSLFNGNISAMVTQFLTPDTTARNLPDTLQMMLKSYRYDCLNRLKMAYSYEDATVLEINEWSEPNATTAYYEGYKYDRNGNITGLQRYNKSGSNGIEMDSLTYHYSIDSGMLANNQLGWVDDRVSVSRFTQDIDDQDSSNYLYNLNGSLIHDEAGQLENINWNLYGKVTAVIPESASGKQRLDFSYDPMGNRMIKRVWSVDDTNSHPSAEFYMRDAQGNILSIYSLFYNAQNHHWQLMNTEAHIYGSSRLGINKRSVIVGLNYGTATRGDSVPALNSIQDNLDTVITDVVNEIINAFQLNSPDTTQLYIVNETLNFVLENYASKNNRPTDTIDGEIWLGIDSIFVSGSEFVSRIPPTYGVWARKKTIERVLGNKQFELTNHLGNVISTVSDRKLAVEDPDNLMYVDNYAPQIKTAQDYYSFGMMMPGRSFTTEDTIVSRTDTIADNPLDDHFDSGIDGWTAIGTGDVSWDNANQRLVLLTYVKNVDGGERTINTIPNLTYTLTCNVVSPDDDRVQLSVYNDNMQLLGSRQILASSQMPVSLNFKANSGAAIIVFTRTTARFRPPGIYSRFYIDDVVVAADTIIDSAFVRIPLASYRFGNGTQEKDNEIYGLGNAYTATYWEYDPRLGRRWNVDPKPIVSLSQYACFENNPIRLIDPLGDSTRYYYKGELVLTTYDQLENALVDLSDLSLKAISYIKDELKTKTENYTDYSVVNSDDFNKYSRRFGVKYFTDEYESFWNKNARKSKCEEDGGYDEYGGFLYYYPKEKEMRLANIAIKGDCAFISYTDGIDEISGKRGGDLPLEDGRLHTHQAPGTSQWDDNGTKGKFYNVEANKKSMEFFNKSDGSYISLPREQTYLRKKDEK